MNSSKGKKEYKKRNSTVEPVFGILKLHHNLENIKQKENKRHTNRIKSNYNRITTSKEYPT
jgi:hypothetical protein